jgi:hypothetical protein
MLAREFKTKYGVFTVQEDIECTKDYCFYNVFLEHTLFGELWTNTSLYNKKFEKEFIDFLKEKLGNPKINRMNYMKYKLYLLIVHNPENEIFIFTSLNKCKKFFIEEVGFEKEDWKTLLDGGMVKDIDKYYWELRGVTNTL